VSVLTSGEQNVGMPDWVIVRGARIERAQFDDNVRDARSHEWIKNQSAIVGHHHCMICAMAMDEVLTKREDIYRSRVGWLCSFCYANFVGASQVKIARSAERRNLLRKLIQLTSPLDTLRLMLAEFPWDSETDLAFFNTQDAEAILQRYLDQSITKEELEAWANMIESREDIGYEQSACHRLKSLIFEMANPTLTQSISEPRARHWLATLRLLARFQDRALEPGDLFLLNSQDARDFLDAAKEAGLVLAGVEGFLITDGGAYQPRQDFSNDRADWNGSVKEFERQTKALFKRGRAAGIRFEVVFENT
jgi:hypothetical protein